MARPQKQGLSYFPLDVDIDQDDKVALIEASHGQLGFAVIIKLLMKIYKEGYFYEWTEKEQLLFSKRTNINIDDLNIIIGDCVKWGLFDNRLFEKYHILTSQGIQKRFFDACNRKKDLQIIDDYLLAEMPQNAIKGVNATLMGVNATLIPQNAALSTQRKLKETKVKETKREGDDDPYSDSQKDMIGRLVITWESNGYGSLNPTTADKLLADAEIFSEQWVHDAIVRGNERGKRNYSYMRAILNSWQTSGKDTPKPEVKHQDSTKVLGFIEREYDMSELERKLLGRE